MRTSGATIPIFILLHTYYIFTYYIYYILHIYILHIYYYRVFSHDITAAILLSQNNETAAMLVCQISPVGVELLSYANAFFCSIHLHRCWPRERKHSILRRPPSYKCGDF